MDQTEQAIDVEHKEHNDDQDRQKFQMESYLIRLFITKFQRHSNAGSQIQTNYVTYDQNYLSQQRTVVSH